MKIAIFNKEGNLIKKDEIVANKIILTENMVDVTNVTDKFNFRQKDGKLVWKEPAKPTPKPLTLEEQKKQKKQEFIQALDLHVQEQISTYNQAKGTVFEDVRSCALYATQPKVRPHDPFCSWIWEYKDDIFDYAGVELAKIEQGTRAMPNTTEELLAEIETKYPVQTQTFIGATNEA